MHWLLLDRQSLGQIVGFIALALCIAAFASKDDNRLLAIMILGNAAFALQFALFGAQVGAAISALNMLRVVLARRLPRNRLATALILAATGAVAAATWQHAVDMFPLVAGVAGTVSMFMLRRVKMRIGLIVAAVCWIVANAAVGSYGAVAAEVMILVTNTITIVRLVRDGSRQAAPDPPRFAAP